MPRQPIVYKPADRPPVEVLVDGTWCYGVLRMWTDTETGWVADVTYYLPGETSGRIDSFPADHVRKDTVQPMHDTTLSVRDHMTLQFADLTWKYPGARNAAIWDLFNETATRYAQRLSVLVDRPEAMQAYPHTVKRLHRLRDARQELRRRTA